MASLGTLAVNLVAKTQPLQAGMQKAKKSVSDFTKTVKSQFGQVGKSFGSVGQKVGALAGKFGPFLAGGAIAGGFAAIAAGIQSSFQNLDQLGKTADKIGIATEQLQALREAANLTGVSANTLDMALQRMVRRISEAAQGSGEAKDALKELGLNAQQLAQQSPDEQFRQIADAFSNVANQGDRVRLAMKLFDSEGVALVNTLELGRQGVDELFQEMLKLGQLKTRGQVSEIEKVNDAIARLSTAWKSFVESLAVEIAPELADFFEELNAAAKSAGALLKFFQKITGRDLQRQLRTDRARRRVFAGGIAELAKRLTGQDGKATRNEIKLTNKLLEKILEAIGLPVDQPSPEFRPIDIR